MPAQVPELPDDVVVLGSYRGGVGADQHMTAPGAVQQLVRQLPVGPRAKPAGQPTPAMRLLRSGCHGAPSPDRPWRGPARREATTVIGAGRGGRVCAPALTQHQLRGQHPHRERHQGQRLPPPSRISPPGLPGLAGCRRRRHRHLSAVRGSPAKAPRPGPGGSTRSGSGRGYGAERTGASVTWRKASSSRPGTRSTTTKQPSSRSTSRTARSV